MNINHVKLISVAFCAGTVWADDTGNWRQPTYDEIRLLFSVATTKPAQSHFFVQIEEIHPPWTAQMVDEKVENFKKRMGPGNSARDLNVKAYREGLATQMTGRTSRYSEEWYSKNYIREDRVEKKDAAKNRPAGFYKNTSEVELYDSHFSEYESFSINYPLATASLNKSPGTRMAPNYLWGYAGMEPKVGVPIVAALSGSSAEDVRDLANLRYEHLSDLRMAEGEVKRLMEGTNKDWRLTVREAQGGGLQFQLTGTISLITGKSDLDCLYEIARVAGRDALVAASYKNISNNSTYKCVRSSFDEHGYPREWRIESTDGKGGWEKRNISLLKAFIDPAFSDNDVFGIPNSTSHPDFTIVDITADRRVVLYSPRPEAAPRSGAIMSYKRAVVFLILFLAGTVSVSAYKFLRAARV